MVGLQWSNFHQFPDAIADVSNLPIYEYLRTSEYSVRYQILHPMCVFPQEFARGDVASDTWVCKYSNNFS